MPTSSIVDLLAAPLALIASLGAPSSRHVTIFHDVTLLPMTGVSEVALEHRTIALTGDRIGAIEPSAAFELPDDARVIDGRGRFLLPGLVHSHVHTNYEDELLRFVAYGVTTVRGTSGRPRHQRWGAEARRNERIGPSFVLAGPTIDSPPIQWPGTTEVVTVRQAEEAARDVKARGYELVKVYNSLGPDVYDAIVRTSELPIIGHVPFRVGPERVLATRAGEHASGGQLTIEHLSGYAPWLQADGPIEIASMAENGLAWLSLDEDRIPDVVAKTCEARVGARADLLLLEEDPRVDIRNTCAIAGVMTRGRWLGDETLQAAPETPFARANDARAMTETPRSATNRP